MTLPIQPPPDMPPAPVPVQVIGYASGETAAVATTGVRVLLGILAGLHLLIGGPLVAWTVIALGSYLLKGYPDPAALVWGTGGLLIGALDAACGVWMLVRRPWTWRAAHLGLAVLCVLELALCGFGAGLIVAYKHAQGWDGIALWIGVFLFGIGSILFGLHALTKLALLRINVRRAFFMPELDPPRLHRIGTIVMMSLYGVILLGGGIAYVVR